MRCSSVILRDQKPDKAYFKASGFPIPLKESRFVPQMNLFKISIHIFKNTIANL